MIVAHPDGVDPAVLPKILSFTKLFWANRGNHNEHDRPANFCRNSPMKQLRAAGLASLSHGAKGMMTETQLQTELEALRPSFFDPDFEPMITAKNPDSGLDILQASANNFYEGVSAGRSEGLHREAPAQLAAYEIRRHAA